LRKFQPDRNKIEQQLDNLNASKIALIEKQKENETAINKALSDWQKEENESIRNLLHDYLESRIETQKLNKLELENLEQKIDQKTNELKSQKERIDNVKEYWKLLEQTNNEQEEIILRAKLRSEIQSMIKKMVVTPLMGEARIQRKAEPKIFIHADFKSIRLIRIIFKKEMNISTRLIMKRVI
jgi:DNA repair exonuclease SbcCD ATPase subunit